MTTCLGIRNATHWADARSIERISFFIICPMLLTHWADNNTSTHVITKQENLPYVALTRSTVVCAVHVDISWLLGHRYIESEDSSLSPHTHCSTGCVHCTCVVYNVAKKKVVIKFWYIFKFLIFTRAVVAFTDEVLDIQSQTFPAFATYSTGWFSGQSLCLKTLLLLAKFQHWPMWWWIIND